MKPIAALAVATAALWAQTGRSALCTVSAIRHWSLGSVTRVAVEVSGEFGYHSDRLHNPDRVYYDILHAQPRIDNKRLFAEDLDDPFVKRVRVAETVPGVTRVVLDINPGVEATASMLSSPDRLIIELRGPAPTMAPLPEPAPVPATVPPAAPAATSPATTTPPATTGLATTSPATASPAKAIVAAILPVEPAALPPPAPARPAIESDGPAPVSRTLQPAPVAPIVQPPPDPVKASPPPVTIAKPARHTSVGSTSLTRALGLKLQRVVIDPGHGGHDEGAQGPKGLLEKDLVLDVALRVGKLIEDRMGAEVIYTRTDDTFIPLERRTALANDKKADLFLSIHANSSPATRATGVETYYLNFTDSKDALDVAARENASSQKSVFELHDLIQQISAHDKAEESRDFASRIQSALFAFSSKTFPAEKNRGVRKAPFVVLIGASMPSVLVEIGFVSNAREEALLKKADYKQKLAEALFRGVAKYADGLSHFQVAEN